MLGFGGTGLSVAKECLSEIYQRCALGTVQGTENQGTIQRLWASAAPNLKTSSRESTVRREDIHPTLTVSANLE